MTIAKAGSLLQIESGEYSSYTVHGFFVVLRDFDPITELREYKYREDAWKDDDFVSYEFEMIQALIARGYLLEIERGVLYLEAYSPQDSRFTPVHVAQQEAP